MSRGHLALVNLVVGQLPTVANLAGRLSILSIGPVCADTQINTQPARRKTVN
jgi:hypothetical protein